MNFSINKITHSIGLGVFIYLVLPFSVVYAAPVVSVGVLEYFPPHYQLNSNGKPTGIAVEILEAAAAKAGMELHYEVYEDLAELQDALQNGEVELVASMGIIPSRLEWASFSIPIETCHLSLFVRSGDTDIDGLDSFQNRLLAVVERNFGARVAEEHGGLRVRHFPNLNDAFYALLSGNVDGLIYPQSVVTRLSRDIRVENRIQVKGEPLLEVKRAIAALKRNALLIERLNPYLMDLIASTEYKDIYMKWYGKEEPYWSTKKLASLFSTSLAVLLVLFAVWRQVSLKKMNMNLADRVVKQTQDLQEREYLFRSLLNNQQEAVFLQPLVSNGFGCFTEVNSKAVERYGYSREEFLKMTAVDLAGEETTRCYLNSPERQRLEQGEAVTFELCHLTKSGAEIPVEITSKVIELHDSSYILSTARDITERKRMDDALKKNEQLLRAAQHVARLGSWEFEPLTGVLWWSEETYSLFGKDPDEFTPSLEGFLELIHPEDREEVQSAYQYSVQSRQPYDIEHRLLLPSGKIRHIHEKCENFFDDAGQLLRSIGTVQDITERKQAELEKKELEAQLRQKLKMEALGVMAGGVAHNFNNSMAVILGNIELAELRKENSEELATYLEKAKQALMRSRDMAHQVLTYSRAGANKKENLSLSVFLNEVVILMRAILPPGIDFTKTVAVGCDNATIYADPVKIQEILINLCNNSIFAMNEVGHLEIVLDMVVLLPQDIPAAYACQPGSYARIRVSDTGCGMSDEVQNKIFDPFFTTKSMEQGTGLGLSTVQGIVKQHHGMIEVQSKPGEGSTFELYFPLLGTDISEAPAEPADPDVIRGQGNILFVDDDMDLVETGQKILEAHGYHVRCVTSPANALELLRESPEDFDLLITDQVMPEFSGTELISRVRDVCPEMPVILYTGYISKISDQSVSKLGINAVCSKPVITSEFQQLVNRLLKSKTDSPA